MTVHAHLLETEAAMGDPVAPQSPWFRATSGFLEVRVSHWAHERGILLCAVIEPPNMPHKLWRRYWTSYTGALAEAERLCDDVVAYLMETTTRKDIRSKEDLDLEDFQNHLKASLNNAFH